MGFKHLHRYGRPTRVNRDPLRKIVGYEIRPLSATVALTHEILECGHALLPKADLVGFYQAGRRRCPFCGQENNRG